MKLFKKGCKDIGVKKELYDLLISTSIKDILIEKCKIDDCEKDENGEIKLVTFKTIQSVFTHSYIYSFINNYIDDKEIINNKLDLINMSDFYILSSRKGGNDEFIILSNDDELISMISGLFSKALKYEN